MGNKDVISNFKSPDAEPTQADLDAFADFVSEYTAINEDF
jgi:hypothetical protein